VAKPAQSQLLRFALAAKAAKFGPPRSRRQAVSMRIRTLLPPLLIVAATSPAWASSATSDGARRLEQSYADYLTHAVIDKGVVSVTPDGDDYVVAWDLEKGIALLGADPGALKAARFSYRLTPTGDGAWRLAADAFPTLTIDAPTDAGRMTGTFELRGFGLQGAYDPSQGDFLRSRLGIDVAHAKLKVADAQQTADTDFAETGIVGETRAKSAADGAGVDVASLHSIASLTETIIGAPADGSGPMALTYSIGGGVGEATLTGLRAKEIAECWKYVVAHGDEAPIPHEFDDKLRAALPLWTNLKLVGKLSDVVMKAPFGQAKAKSVAETIGLSGLTAPAAAEFGVQVDSVTIDSSQAPPWAAKLTPASLNFDLKFSGGGLDRAAQIALDDPSFATNGDLSPDAQEQIDAALLGGDPKLTLAPGRLSTPTLDLAYEGEASVVAGEPRGRLVVSADGLDKAIVLLQEIAGADPESEAAIFSLTYAKGLAKSGTDGRLTWTIEFRGGEVTVNGSPLPTGK
jgi:hypothetical protein